MLEHAIKTVLTVDSVRLVLATALLSLYKCILSYWCAVLHPFPKLTSHVYSIYGAPDLFEKENIV